MDKNETANRLIELGKEEARLMRKLARVQAERCKLLCDAIPEAGLDGDVAARASEPKHK